MITSRIFCMIILWSLVYCREKAVLEITMAKLTEHGEYKTEVETIFGHFSTAGPTVSAEGDILQIHPMSICSRDLPEKMVYGWVGVMKLEKQIVSHCLNLYEQAKVAIKRGATAVVFDISNVPEASKKLRQYASVWQQLERPVIIIYGNEAIRLMTIIRTHENAWARIRFHETSVPEQTQNESKEDVGIIVAVLVVVFIVVVSIFTVVKFKCRHREQQLTMSELAKQAIAKLETRKYQCKKEKFITRVITPTSDVYSQTSYVDSCAICLEEYNEGQVLRVLPCSHEFHSICVDPWLVDHRTCPFCMYNIIEPQQPQQAQRTQRQEVRMSDQRQFYQLPPPNTNYNPITHSQYLHYLNYHSELHNACTSCESTIGSSSVSSCGSCLYEYQRNAHHRFYPEPLRRSYYQSLPTPCCANGVKRTQDCANNVKRTKEIGHVLPCNSSCINSGISYSHHITSSSVHHHTNYCHTHQQIHNSTHHYFLGHSTRLFQYNKNRSGPTCDSEPEYNSGKDASIKAQYGSCSSESCSDGNPSSSSLECPDCVHHCGNNVANSNQSTCGSSSENTESGDNASYDSNVFWGGAPDQMCTDLSSSLSELSCHKNLCQCSVCKNDNLDVNSGKDCKHCDSKNSSSTLNLSELSGCNTAHSDLSSSSSHHSCESESSVDGVLNLSEVSGLTARSNSDISLTSQKTQDVDFCSECIYAKSQSDLSPKIPFKLNTIPRNQTGSLLSNRCHDLECITHSFENHNINSNFSACVHNHNALRKLANSSYTDSHNSQCADQEQESLIYNLNTQGRNLLQDCNELCIAPRTLTREKSSFRNMTDNLLPSFRLSRSCDILPSSKNSNINHSSRLISTHPRLLTKDSIVKATSKGSTVTVFLKEEQDISNGNIV